MKLSQYNQSLGKRIFQPRFQPEKKFTLRSIVSVHHRNEQKSHSTDLALWTHPKDSLGYLHISTTLAYAHSFFYVLFVSDDSRFLTFLFSLMFLVPSVFIVLYTFSLFLVFFVFYDQRVLVDILSL